MGLVLLFVESVALPKKQEEKEEHKKLRFPFMSYHLFLGITNLLALGEFAAVGLKFSFLIVGQIFIMFLCVYLILF